MAAEKRLPTWHAPNYEPSPTEEGQGEVAKLARAYVTEGVGEAPKSLQKPRGDSEANRPTMPSGPDAVSTPQRVEVPSSPQPAPVKVTIPPRPSVATPQGERTPDQPKKPDPSASEGELFALTGPEDPPPVWYGSTPTPEEPVSNAPPTNQPVAYVPAPKPNEKARLQSYPKSGMPKQSTKARPQDGQAQPTNSEQTPLPETILGMEGAPGVESLIIERAKELSQEDLKAGKAFIKKFENSAEGERLRQFALQKGIPTDLLQRFYGLEGTAFRAGQKIKEVMGWGREKIPQAPTSLKLGSLALVGGEAIAIASDRFNTLQAAAFASGVIGLTATAEKTKEWRNKSSRLQKTAAALGVGAVALTIFGIWGSMRYGGTGGGGKKMAQQLAQATQQAGEQLTDGVKTKKPEGKGSGIGRAFHEAISSIELPKPKTPKNVPNEIIPRGSGSSAGEVISATTGRTATTATTKATKVATTVATELKPGAETTQRTTKAAEKSGKAFQKAQELKFRTGMANHQAKIKRRLRYLERIHRAKQRLSETEANRVAREISQGDWKNLNSPGAAERVAEMSPTGASKMLDHVISQELGLAA